MPQSVNGVLSINLEQAADHIANLEDKKIFKSKALQVAAGKDPLFGDILIVTGAYDECLLIPISSLFYKTYK